MKPLLLVIDMQTGWRHRATKETMQEVVRLCRQFPGDVIHCCFRNDPSSLFYSQLHWREFTGAPDINQIPEIAALHLPVYWRSAYSCLTPEVAALVKSYSHVYIAGVFTDISVAATAMNLFDRGVPVSVVADCVATLHGEDVHQAALKSLDHAIGVRNLVSAKSLIGKTTTV